MIQFIIGGARSGKSSLAQHLAMSTQQPVTYIATAEAHDDEMQARIDHHRANRPKEWTIIEEPLSLAATILSHDHEGHVILVDCLTLWMTNLLLCPDPSRQITECNKLVDTLSSLKSEVILVSNETGLGVIPMGNLSRQFVDESGRLHQTIAKIADRVIFCVAGLPMILKGNNI